MLGLARGWEGYCLKGGDREAPPCVCLLSAGWGEPIRKKWFGAAEMGGFGWGECVLPLLSPVVWYPSPRRGPWPLTAAPTCCLRSSCLLAALVPLPLTFVSAPLAVVGYCPLAGHRPRGPPRLVGIPEVSPDPPGGAPVSPRCVPGLLSPCSSRRGTRRPGCGAPLWAGESPWGGPAGL